MNLLAHIYLSGSNDQIRIGNFIGDYVKGRKYRLYPPMMMKGILLHRSIDTYTDHNILPGKVKSIFRPAYRKYAGIVVDLFYDHFLANGWETYSAKDLSEYIEDFYGILESRFDQLPPAVQSFVPGMIRHNRLYSYKYLEGIEKALYLMSQHTSLPDQTSQAMKLLSENYHLINNNFHQFFPRIISNVESLYDVAVEYHKAL